MPDRAKRPCATRGCRGLTSTRYCTACKPQPEMNRAERSALYDDPKWRSESTAYRQQHPLCECELHRGRPGAPPSTMVDHRRAHRGDRVLFWDKTNWCAMAKPCHQSKTNRFDRDESNPYDDGNFKTTRSVRRAGHR